jgi:hypothetical protein
VHYEPVSSASPAVTRYATLLALTLGVFELWQGITERGHQSVETAQLDRVYDAIRNRSESTLQTARREIDLSCYCCRNDRREK